MLQLSSYPALVAHPEIIICYGTILVPKSSQNTPTIFQLAVAWCVQKVQVSEERRAPGPTMTRKSDGPPHRDSEERRAPAP